MTIDFFENAIAQMQGLTLEGMKGLVRTGRVNGKLGLYRHGSRWLLLYRPPGGRRDGWVNCTFYLMAEKSCRPRLFARADTALGVAAQMCIPGIWMDFSFPQGSIPVIGDRPIDISRALSDNKGTV